MVTDSKLSWGNQLGAQLTELASLTYICEENKQQLVLWKELIHYRRGYQFLDVFELADIPVLERAGSFKQKIIVKYCSKYKLIESWQEQMKRIYGSRIYRYLDKAIYEWIRFNYRDFYRLYGSNNIHTDSQLLALDINTNYDIISGFGTYQDWKKYEKLIKARLVFKKNIQTEGDIEFSKLKSSKKKVSVHFRRTDYLVMASLNLDNTYYKRALDIFDKDQHQFIVFSDDIDACKEMPIFDGFDVVFMEPHSAAVDMYLMSKCDANIIANSTFSFWGAFLNDKPEKVVVCPHDFIRGGNSSYINGNYFPDSWIAL